MSFNQEAYDKDLLEEGKKIGEERLSKLIQKLLAENRSKDIERITIDKEYQKQLMDEYKLN